MTAAKGPIPGPEAEWYTHSSCQPPAPHELMVSEARAVEEALARLGPGTDDEALQRDLERLGIRVELPRIAAIRAAFHQAGRAGTPSDLVRTEGERAPPPGPAATSDSAAPAPGQGERAARPSDLVKTEGETVPPPRR